MLKCSLGKLFRIHHGKFPMTFSRAFSRTTWCLKSHYDTLKVNPSASLKEIKEAYFKLSKQYHPDLHPNDPSCHDRFIRLQEAYQILSNTQARREYDAGMQFRNNASRNSNSRPYGYPDFTQRDEWLRNEQAKREQKFRREFHKDEYGFDSFHRYYSRPHNLTPEEIERFFKYKRFMNNNHVVVVLCLFVFAVAVVETLFVRHRKQAFAENIHQDIWRHNTARYYGIPMDPASRKLNDFEYERNLRRTPPMDNTSDADSKSDGAV